jgi:hypothetical protein
VTTIAEGDSLKLVLDTIVNLSNIHRYDGRRQRWMRELFFF